MACTTLTITKATPVLTLSNKSFIHSDCSELLTCTKTITEMGAANYVSFECTVQVTIADAKYKLKFDWNLDGVSKTYTTGLITQNIGTTMAHCVTIGSLWVVGAYTALTVVAIDTIAA